MGRVNCPIQKFIGHRDLWGCRLTRYKLKVHFESNGSFDKSYARRRFDRVAVKIPCEKKYFIRGLSRVVIRAPIYIETFVKEVRKAKWKKRDGQGRGNAKSYLAKLSAKKVTNKGTSRMCSLPLRMFQFLFHLQRSYFTTYHYFSPDIFHHRGLSKPFSTKRSY